MFPPLSFQENDCVKGKLLIVSDESSVCSAVVAVFVLAVNDASLASNPWGFTIYYAWKSR